MLHCFNFTVGQLKSRRQVDKNPALAFENDCNSRFRISIGFGFQNKGPAKIPPFARHKVRCYRQTTSTSLFPDDRADRLQELSVRRLQRWTWIGKDAKGFGVGIHWLPRRTQKNEAHPGGVYSFHADNIIVKYRNVVIDVADLTSRARPKLAKATNSVPKRTNLTILIRTLALWNTSWVIVAKVCKLLMAPSCHCQVTVVCSYRQSYACSASLQWNCSG